MPEALVARSTKEFLGNICSHVFTTRFLRDVTAQPLPHHVVHKKIKHVASPGGVAAKAPGIKLERL